MARAGNVLNVKLETVFGKEIFSKSRMSLQKWLLIIYLWTRDYPVTDAAQEVEITKTSAIDVFQWLREVCRTKLLQNQIVLGGLGTVV